MIGGWKSVGNLQSSAAGAASALAFDAPPGHGTTQTGRGSGAGLEDIPDGVDVDIAVADWVHDELGHCPMIHTVKKYERGVYVVSGGRVRRVRHRGAAGGLNLSSG